EIRYLAIVLLLGIDGGREACVRPNVAHEPRRFLGVGSMRLFDAKKTASTHSARGVTLLDPDRITTADRAAPHHGSIHADVDLVMLGRCAQDSGIAREIPLRESGHHATPARTGDVQAHRRPDGERMADPGILGKALLT